MKLLVRAVRTGRCMGVMTLICSLMAAAHAAPFAYITNQGSHDVSVIDLATQAVIATVPVGRSPAGVVAASRTGRVFISNPDGRTAFVAERDDDSVAVSVFDAQTLQPVHTLNGFGYPEGIAAHGDKIYVVNWMDDDAKLRYSYRARDGGALPVTNYTSTISVKAEGDKAVVEWRGAFYRGYPNNDPPPDRNDEAAVKAVTAVYQSGLANLKQIVEAGGAK